MEVKITTLCKPAWRKRSATCDSWLPIPGRSRSTTPPASLIPINPFNPSLSRALSTFDIAHNFVVSYGYELPFFRNGHGGRPPSCLGGWSVSGITRFNTGFPVTLTEDDDRLIVRLQWRGRTELQRPAPFTFSTRASRAILFFDPSPLLPPRLLGLLGNAKRRFFHGPGINNWDLAVRQIYGLIGERNGPGIPGRVLQYFQSCPIHGRRIYFNGGIKRQSWSGH